jgi:hypothetical protein
MRHRDACDAMPCHALPSARHGKAWQGMAKHGKALLLPGALAGVEAWRFPSQASKAKPSASPCLRHAEGFALLCLASLLPCPREKLCLAKRAKRSRGGDKAKDGPGYPNLPDVEAIRKAAYVKIYPAEKCANPTSRAWTIESATGLSLQRTSCAKGVRSWAQASVSISSCQ